jgi:hypothetical protein
MNYTKHIDYKKEMKCSVEGCNSNADYEVVLYDYYSYVKETFYEQDFTCPFICEKHMLENEKKAIGERRPRGYVSYPYTNKHHALGYSKYNPIKDIYPELYDASKIENNADLQISLEEINSELIEYLAKYPEYLHKLSPRKFEELIAKLFENHGYEVTLTPETRDGGKDIIAVYNSPFGHQMFIVECKKHKEGHKVGVEFVRALYGVKHSGSYTQAILATTSSFTKDAIDFVKPHKYDLLLKDSKDIEEWLRNYKNKL